MNKPTNYGHTEAKAQIQISIPNKYLGCGYKGLVFFQNNGTHGRGTHSTKMGADSLAGKYPKCPKIYRPNLSAQAKKFWISMKIGLIGRLQSVNKQIDPSSLCKKTFISETKMCSLINMYFLREKEEIFFTYSRPLLVQNVNEIEFELSRMQMKLPFIILAKVFMYIRCIF